MGKVGFPGGSDGKKAACNGGDPSLIPGSGSSPGEGIGYPLQYSCLENPMDRGDCRPPWGHKELDTTDRLSLHFLGKAYCPPQCRGGGLIQSAEDLKRTKITSPVQEGFCQQTTFRCELQC